MTVRSLTPEEKHFLRQQGYSPKHFLLLNKNAEGYEFLETQTGKILSLRR
jgi:hypothetical protein